MSRKTWIVTDTHWNHKGVYEWCSRPNDFDRRLENNWISSVKKWDTVIHLGDVTFGSSKDLYYRLRRLPGIKILVRGNHDKSHSDSWFKDVGFSHVCDSIRQGSILLSHKPQKLLEEGEVSMNIHGHFHNADHQIWEPEIVSVIENRHYLLSIEYTNYNLCRLHPNLNVKQLQNTKKLMEQYSGKHND